MNEPKPNPSRRHLPPGVNILHEDNDILVVEKPHGLLTIGTEQRKTGTLYAKLTEYVRKGNSKSRNRIFVVHRLDRDASGLLVFAKTVEAKTILQARWEETKKLYLAVVHGRLAKPSGVITSYLMENEATFVRSTRDPDKGKLSRTGYRVLKESGGFSLLEIDLLTGRKHQIRVHLSELGHPIAGDRKYGDRKGEGNRLALHAQSLAFSHPVTGKPLAFETETPGYFTRLMRGPDTAKSPRSRPDATPKKNRQR